MGHDTETESQTDILLKNDFIDVADIVKVKPLIVCMCGIITVNLSGYCSLRTKN